MIVWLLFHVSVHTIVSALDRWGNQIVFAWEVSLNSTRYVF